jgi:two-component system sensor histidine kinase AlgZ
MWLPLGAGALLAALLAVLALPLYGHGVATWSRTVFLSTLLLWMLPLTLLQRAWWRRSWSMRRTWLLLLPVTLCMVLLTKWLHLWPQRATGEAPDLAWLWRGLEAPWLGLLAFAALHALIVHAWELRATRIRVRQAEQSARDAQLHALQLQLQPHFLFNTLNAISSEVGDGHAAVAQQMLARLGDLLRATLELGGQATHSLAAELSLVESYLDIERVRLGERMRVDRQIAPGLLDAEVPTLSLQPLLENALRHGLAPRRAPGTLRLRIWRERDTLRVDIANDLPETAPSASPGGGVGLANLRARLAQLYGVQAALECTVDHAQFRVQLSLPWRESGGR